MDKLTVTLLVIGGLFALAQVIVCAIFASKAAQKRNRDTLGWFFLGLFFGPIALLALIAIGPLTDDEE